MPADSRVARYGSFGKEVLTEDNLERLRGLDALSKERGQSLAQMALGWALRDPRMTCLVLGASSVAQLEQNVETLDRLDFSADELAQIDHFAVAGGVDLWKGAREGQE